MKLYNTLTRQIDTIEPLQPPCVSVYTCGPTVYDYAHIGHWFNYVRMDMMIRTLKLNGYDINWVMNITDVGHLVSDGDEGEDKLEKGAKREGKTAWEVAEFYTADFLLSMKLLHITTPDHITKATDHIMDQIELIKVLEAKGFTYIISDGVYYDTSKFEGYSAFARLDIDGQQAGARVDYNREKRNPTDFALWKFSPKVGTGGQRRDMEWWSPWRKSDGFDDSEEHNVGLSRATLADDRLLPSKSEGETVTQRGSWGFPGWHIECSAMAMKYLGETLDIHAGGIDHIPVHHTNEIAQSEAATNRRFANYWMHSNHLTVNGEKISKSLGNGVRLQTLIAGGIPPEAVRLHILESHYRSQSKFSQGSLTAAYNRLLSLRAMAVRRYQPLVTENGIDTKQLEAFKTAIQDKLNQDLDTPQALVVLSRLETAIDTSGVNIQCQAAYNELLEWLDIALGLGLTTVPDINIEQKRAIADHQTARGAKDWVKSDLLRDELVSQDITVRDTDYGPIWSWTK